MIDLIVIFAWPLPFFPEPPPFCGRLLDLDFNHTDPVGVASLQDSADFISLPPQGQMNTCVTFSFFVNTHNNQSYHATLQETSYTSMIHSLRGWTHQTHQLISMNNCRSPLFRLSGIESSATGLGAPESLIRTTLHATSTKYIGIGSRLSAIDVERGSRDRIWWGNTVGLNIGMSSFASIPFGHT